MEEKDLKGTKTEKKPAIKHKLLAAIRIRGVIGLKQSFKDTLSMLRLYKKNSCVILEDTPVNRGMLVKVKDFITYGEVDEETLHTLAKQRKKQNYSSRGLKVFRLSPPKKGFGRKGIKWSFVNKGALGYRGDKINDLIKRMI
jgi:large subunit ribosomal protein L30